MQHNAAGLLKSRRTTHLFDPSRPVAVGVVREALQLAVQAPNHRTTEPWRFYVLGPETRERLITLNTDMVRARNGDTAAESKQKHWQDIPGFLVVTCQRSADALRQQEDYAACACAIQNLMLYLWSEGIGTKWTTGGVTRDARFFRLIGLDEEEAFVVGLVQYGYPAVLPAARHPESEPFTHWLP